MATGTVTGRRPAKAGGRKPAKKAPKRGQKKAPRTLSATHKKALADGRSLANTVDRYLVAIQEPKRRGRKVSLDTMRKRLATSKKLSGELNGVAHVLMLQRVRDLERQIASESHASPSNVKELEVAFVKVAKRFGEKRGIGYGAWRDAGVSAAVLSKCGIARTRG